MNYKFEQFKTKTFVAGCFMLSIGILVSLEWSSFFDTEILFKQFQLRPGTVFHKYWMEPPQPLYLDIYFFNWTNPEDFTNSSINPNFEEIGPFRFQEFPTKENITWHDKNFTVSYRKQSRYFFVPEQSKGSLDDVITSVNVIALSSAVQARSWNILKIKGIEMSLAFFGQKVHLTKTANEWLFEGYEDPIIGVAKDIASILEVGEIPFDKFGWFYQRNGSSLLTGDFNADTGVDNVFKVGQLRKWNFESQTKFFPGECSKLSGSAGEFFPPGMTKEETVSIFSSEMCRSIELEFEEERNIHGVNVLKYIGGDKTLDNGTLYPENKCYCSGDCVPSGLFNVSSCRYGTPVFMSFPHFYKADPFYQSQVDGMKPDKEKHEFSMSFEPKTSLPMEVAARFQLNLLISPIPRFNLYKNVPRRFMPIIWFEQHVLADESLGRSVRLMLAGPMIGEIMGIVTVLIAITLMAFSFVKKEKKELDEKNPKSVELTEIPAESYPLMN